MSTNLTVYTHLTEKAFSRKLSNLDSAETNLKAMLLTEEYIPNQHDHKTILDIEEFEIEGQSYEAGGLLLDNISIEFENGITTFSADNISWEDSTLEFRYMVVYDDTPEAKEDKNLLFFADFGQTIKTRKSQFAIRWSDDGIFNIAVSVDAQIFAVMPVFTVGMEEEFTVSSIANDDYGRMVRAHFVIPEDLEMLLEYQEQDPNNSSFGEWLPLTGTVFGPSTGFPLTDVTSNFRATFGTPGVFSIGIKFKDVETGEVVAMQTVELAIEDIAKSELEVEMPVFVAGQEQEFEMSVIANEHAGILSRAYFTIPEGMTNLKYQEMNPEHPQYLEWFELKGNAFGPASGFPLMDGTGSFRATFEQPGTYEVTVEYRTMDTEEVLVSKTFEIIVEE